MADEAKANPTAGPGFGHEFGCTHDPCRCAATQELFEGKWRPSCPLPYYLRFGRCRCECGQKFRKEASYETHWRSEHA